jgi:hypothetical protein
VGDRDRAGTDSGKRRCNFIVEVEWLAHEHPTNSTEVDAWEEIQHIDVEN